MAGLVPLHHSDNTSHATFTNTGQQQQGSKRRVRVVPGSTFDGVAFEIALSDAVFDHGSSANIRRGKLLGTDPLVVAVKVFGEILDPVKQELLVRELRFAKDVSLCHPLILAFLGTAIVGEQTALVSLYMSNGNLMEYIKGHPGCDKKKLANVLISDFGDALLADFGLSTFAEKSQFASATMTAIRQMNTLQFAAPELLLGDGTGIASKTCESDVYAFGMLVLEALTVSLPWPNHCNLSIMRKVCSGEHPVRPTEEGTYVPLSHSWWDTCRNCWSFEPRNRPSISGVLSALRGTDRMPYRLLHFQAHVMFVAYTPDGNTIIVCGPGGFSGLYDVRTSQTRRFSWIDSNSTLTVAVSPDCQRIVASAEKTIRIWDIASDTLVASIDHQIRVHCVAYSPDGARIASAAGDDGVHLWNAGTGAAVGRLLGGHLRGARLVAFSPDGTCIAFVSADDAIFLSDSTTGVLMGAMEPCDRVDGSVLAICFSPDGKHLVTGCSDGVIAVWDVHTRQPVHVIDAGRGHVWRIAFSPAGTRFASGSMSGEINIWDARSGIQIGTPFTGQAGIVESIAFSPDRRTLVSAANDGVVRVQDLLD